jgi:hypothetical protein
MLGPCEEKLSCMALREEWANDVTWEASRNNHYFLTDKFGFEGW